MADSISHLVERIHASPHRAVIAVTGAGGQALAWILSLPGASMTVLEAIVPYGRISMRDFLGHEPAQFVSREAAREMAESAYSRALHLREAGEPVIGLACTATIATDRPKRGEHRCFVAAQDGSGVTTYDLKLAKGRRDRAGEEVVVSRLILRALSGACGIDEELSLGLLDTELLEEERTEHGDPLVRLLSTTEQPSGGRGVATVTVQPDGMLAVDQIHRGVAVLPGSFSPLHEGHRRLARAASEMLNTEVVFEISVTNVDKPPLAEAEVRHRLRQFEGWGTVVLTRAPRFYQKAAVFPDCTFIVGWDTAARLVHPRYYGGREGAIREALDTMRDAGCRFLVAGREEGGAFRTLSDVPIPGDYSNMFEAIPESRFRADVSSTELRKAHQ